MDFPNVAPLIEENIQITVQDMKNDQTRFYFSVALLNKFMQSGKNICVSLFNISFSIFVIISQRRNNEVKYAIIKIRNANPADDYERTLNCKW